MAYHSKAEAARMAGVSRATISRRVDSGKLSAVDGKIETSEMLRVWPNSKVDNKKYQSVHDAALVLEAEISQLKLRLEAANALLDAKDQHLDELGHSLKLLELQKALPADKTTFQIFVLCASLIACFTLAVVFSG